MFKRIGIVGAGFMGTSFALGVKEKFPGTKTIAFARRDASFRRLKKLKVFDAVRRSLDEVVSGCDLLVLSLPVTVIGDYFERIAPHVKKNTVILDLGSTKEQIMRSAKKHLKCPENFVGCHPLCGSEEHGAGAATKHLYKNSLCIITSSPRSQSTKKVSRLWKRIGAQVRFLSASRHDKILSAVSHLPHVLAFSLAQAVPRTHHAFAPLSFREMTRIASSSPDVWCDIFSANRGNITKDIAACVRVLNAFKRDIEKGRKKQILSSLSRANKKIESLQKP